MKSPSSASAISHDWVEFVVQHHEAKSHPDVAVKLTSFSVVPATKPGENFNSELVLVEANAEVRRGDSEDDSQLLKKEYSFIAKFLSVDPFNKEMVKMMGQHLRELVIYSKLVGELNSHWEANASCLDVDQKLAVPEYIYGICSPSEYVLVMENCKQSKFETNDAHKGLNLAQILLAVDQLARLHALSRSYNLTTNVCEKYPCIAFNYRMSDFMKPFGSVVLESAIKFLRTLPEHKDIVAKLEKGHTAVSQKFCSLLEDRSQHQMLCLTHGDFWNNNILFRYQSLEADGEREVEAVKVIDWQNSQWNNPVVDLHYLLCTSTTAEIRHNHLDDILQHYHSSFMRISENVKTPAPDWNYDQFYSEFSRMSLVGFLLGLCLVQGTLSKAGEKLTSDASGYSSTQSQKSFGYKVKTVAAKAMGRLFLKPSFQSIYRKVLKKMLKPVVQELVDGQNTVMNERVLGLVLEADKKGVFNV
ncbi:Protein of unknown function DUF227 [Trinorchestia longiramus]|nr:Protein of unknown function DUF227 [Trinorchestia longiramus]